MSQLLSAFRHASLPPAAQGFRAEVREFLHTAWTPPAPQVRSRSWMGFDAAFSRKLAQRGWVGVTLPKEYGGASMDAFSRFVLVEELLAAGAGPGRSAFLSAFFALIGCHGLHVSAGLLWLLTMMAQVYAKGYRADIQRRLLCFALFWHTLDIIWVALFSLVYLVGVAPR